MGGATILGALSGIVLALVALSMRWRRTAIWAAVAAATLITNLAFLIRGTESGTTMVIGMFLPAIVALGLMVSYIVEQRRRRRLPGAE